MPKKVFSKSFIMIKGVFVPLSRLKVSPPVVIPKSYCDVHLLRSPCFNFRKKSLSCHPDKHPDDPNAVEIFVQLCQAQKLLLEQFECQNNSIFDDLFDEQKSTFASQWTSNSTSQSQNARVRI